MDVVPSIIVLAITTLLVYRRELTTPRPRKAPRAQPPQGPAKRAKLPGEIAKAQRCAGHSREASTAFSEACTAYFADNVENRC